MIEIWGCIYIILFCFFVYCLIVRVILIRRVWFVSVSKLIRGGIFSVFLINILLGGFLVSLFKLLIILIKIYKSYI